MPELHLLSPRGFRAAGVYAGIKSKQTNDVGLLVCDEIAAAAALFTTNKVFAAPIKVGRENVRDGRIKAVVVNAGNANACTGKRGEKDARRMCFLAAAIAHCDPTQILPSSTGIIGRPLPMDKVEHGIISAGQGLGSSHEHALQFMDAILTTDLKRKSAATTFKIGKETVTVAGVCKGSGMIGPRMALDKAGGLQSPGLKGLHATMLAYLTTDASISAPTLRKLLDDTTRRSFNAVTVDDHTSTNDTAAILASGHSAKIDSARAVKSFHAALDEVCQSLAYQIAADGEGATKVVKIIVTGAATQTAADTMARAIAVSPLVKTAMHGNDPNWGRLISAAGYAGVPFNPDKCTLTLQGTIVFHRGQAHPIDAAKLSAALKAPEAVVEINCRLGKFSATMWTCDLSKDYITINADYHT